MQRLLILNFLLSLLWPTLNGGFTLRSLFIGFVLGFVVLAVIDRRYGRFTWQLTTFTIYVLYAILESNFRLAAIVLRELMSAQSTVNPGIVAIPLVLEHPVDITLLASIITLTPGTLSVDLKRNPSSADLLFVHSMNLDDPDAFRTQIKETFELRILNLRQLLEAMESSAERPATRPPEKE